MAIQASKQTATQTAAQAPAQIAAQAEYRATSRPRDLPPSGYYGVSASNDRWQAWIKYGGKRHYIGSFRTKQEAACAYDQEARRCGEEKPLNYSTLEQAKAEPDQARAERECKKRKRLPARARLHDGGPPAKRTRPAAPAAGKAVGD